MKKIFSFFSFLSKVFLLILLVAVGWAFVNVSNLIKGKKHQAKNPDSGDLFGADHALADVPGGSSTPFLAYSDGKKFIIENDILFGKPKSYYPVYRIARSLYEDGRIYPDLYKINAPIRPHGGKLRFQIQEIEPEESYFSWLELLRVIHPENSEVVVDSEFKKYYVVEKSVFEKNVILPASVTTSSGQDVTEKFSKKGASWRDSSKTDDASFLNSGQEIEMIFRGLKHGEIPHLVMKSWYRDWVLGMERDWQEERSVSSYPLVKSKMFVKMAAVATAVFGVWFFEKLGFNGSALILTPMVFGTQGGCCLVVEYRDASGEYERVAVADVRSWKMNTEVIEFPMQAIMENGEMRVRIRSSKKHALGFLGVIQERDLKKSSRAFTEEKLQLERAHHNRLDRDVVGVLSKTRKGEYVQTIPGDTVNLEFRASGKIPNKDEKETYLFRASGFYSALRDENARIAGDWRSRIPDEAKERLASLVSLRDYR